MPISPRRCGQLVQQRPRVSEVGRVEAFGKPGVDLGQHVSRVLTLALPLQQATQTRRGSELERAATATTGQLDRGSGSSSRPQTRGHLLGSEAAPHGSDRSRKSTPFRGSARESPPARRGPCPAGRPWHRPRRGDRRRTYGSMATRATARFDADARARIPPAVHRDRDVPGGRSGPSEARACAPYQRRFGLRDGFPVFSPPVVYHGRVVERDHADAGMGELAGESQRLLAVPERPVGISTRPGGDGRKIQATDAGVVPAVDRCIGTVPLRIVLREALLEMELRGLEVAAAVQGRPQRVVGLEKKDGISELPGQAEELLPEVSRLSIEPPIEAHVPQAPEGGEEPRAVVEPETQLPRGDVRGLLFGCAVPVDRAEAGTESDADVEGLTRASPDSRAAVEARPRPARKARSPRGWPSAPPPSLPPGAGTAPRAPTSPRAPHGEPAARRVRCSRSG